MDEDNLVAGLLTVAVVLFFIWGGYILHSQLQAAREPEVPVVVDHQNRKPVMPIIPVQ